VDIVQHQIARRYDRNQGLGGSPLAGTDWVTSSEECEQTLAELERNGSRGQRCAPTN
jgi:hypothetical protein